MTNRTENLPLPIPHFCIEHLVTDPVLRCVDGNWTYREDGQPVPPDRQFLVLATARGLQCWQGGQRLNEIVERPGEPLPDVEELNGKIPVAEWDEGLDGKPRPPWMLHYATYLLDVCDAAKYVAINSTAGMKRAWKLLNDRIEWMRALRGENVTPLVVLRAKPMPTDYGKKLRPHFEIIEWRSLGGARSTIEAEPVKAIEHKPATQAAKPAKPVKPGKPVKPVTIEEELNDELPF